MRIGGGGKSTDRAGILILFLLSKYNSDKKNSGGY
jgi:hypothetical protein